MPLICGHDAPPYHLPVCEHIRTAPEPLDHHLHYTGRGMDRQRICAACRTAATGGGAVPTARLCEPCFDATAGATLGTTGLPQTLDAARPVAGAGPLLPLPASAGPVVDLAPTAGGLLLLTEDGRILAWDPDGGTPLERGRSAVRVPEDAKPWSGHDKVRRLHASPDGRFAAVVVDFGRHGEVIDLATGAVTMSLENDGYYEHTVPFSLAFTTHEGRTVLLHRRRWNRVEAADPATGELLALMPDREPQSAWSHHFHGALHLSPAGTRIASDAWLWHPLGEPVTWELRRWLDEGARAALDTLGFRRLPGCEYHWNRPMVWLDEARLVIGGIGDDEEELVPGATVVDVTRSEDHAVRGWGPARIAEFGGPQGRFFAGNGLLFSSSPAGLEIWDPVVGARTGTVPDFHPTHHDPFRGELLELSASGLRRRPTSDTT
ncbi:hypothetical protein [Streptomyces sp. NPDC047014]|uniref:hypothetical protein n=1 Tax=Streptomyces sp. NPDC047014 TaxID=3155736 RepID=UPI0033F6E05C